MRYRIGVLVTVAGLLMSLAAPVFSHAQTFSRNPRESGGPELGAIVIQNTSVQVNFPASIAFNISARHESDITDIRLRYIIQRERFAESFSESFVVFRPGTSVTATWTMDMQRTGGLPTGTTINYWWVLKDASGVATETGQQSVDFSDNRFTWRSLSEGNVTLHWHVGDDEFARQLMAAAQDALQRLASSTGANLSRPIRIYVYGSAQELQGSMIFSAEWTGGVAFTPYSIVAIGIPTNQLEWGKRAMSHELTHLAVHQVTFNPYGGLPTWLDEGLAVLNEGPVDPAFASLLDQAIRSKSLISMRSLSSPFSAYGNEATLSYSQSFSFVNHLIATHGQARMSQLLQSFQQGATYDDALQQVYGKDMDELYAEWRAKFAPSVLSGVLGR